MNHKKAMKIINDHAKSIDMTPHAMLVKAQIPPSYYWRWKTQFVMPSQVMLDKIRLVKPNA